VNTARRETRLALAQRASAAILALCTLIHLATIVYAIRGGLSAGEILERTRSSVAAAAFYGLFLAAVVVHAPLGLRNVAREWLGLHGRALEALTVALAVLLLGLGGRALWAVVG
jgi:fumarate reductase subunit C